MLRRLKAEFIDVRFARFLVFGCTTAAVNLVVGGFLYSSDATENLMPYWVAVTIAGVMAMIVGFVLNYYFNFRYQGRSVIAQFRTYALIAFSCIVLTTAFSEAGLELATEIFARDGFMIGSLYVSYEFASHFCAVGSVAVYSYLSHKYLTFNVGIRGAVNSALERRRSAAASNAERE